MTSHGLSDHGSSKERKSWLIGKLLRIITIIVAFFTLISGYGSVFNPSKFWIIALTGLGFPILFAINFALLILWVARRRIIAWIPLAALIITLFKLTVLFQWNGESRPPDFIEGQSEEIPVMSFNVRLFDLYNWSHSNQTKARIFDMFDSEQPKILCLQEFYSSDRKGENNEKKIASLLGFKHRHVEYPINLYDKDHYGIATYSHYPIINKGVLYFNEKTANICIFSDIKIDNDTVRVYNCHLQSVRFDEQEYEFLENIGNDREDEPSGEEAARRTRNIISRLKHAFIQRAEQADLIADHIRLSPFPVIVCGDFNDTPVSYTYKTISEGLVDAFRESGNGLGTTYAGPIPGLRIDYILHSEKIKSYKFMIGKEKMSDHYPLSVTLVIY